MEVVFATELSIPVIIFRLMVSFIAGGLIGAEREGHTTPAGLRTHILICTGATLIMMLSMNVGNKGGDPGRIAAQVVSGIGFLGAGAIMRFGATVQGLTSAASIWTVAALGLAVGAGFIPGALIFTLLLLITLVLLDRFEKRYMRHRELRAVHIVQKGQDFDIKPFRDILENHGAALKNIEISFSKEKMETAVKLIIKLPKGVNISDIADELSTQKKLIKFRVNQEI